MNTDDLVAVRARAESAGLTLDDERLSQLVGLLREFSGMLTAFDGVEIDPTDLALETFDPAWSEVEPTR